MSTDKETREALRAAMALWDSMSLAQRKALVDEAARMNREDAPKRARP